MSPQQKPNTRKRKQPAQNAVPHPSASTKRPRSTSLSPLRSSDPEDDPRTREKIIAELRKELAQVKAEVEDVRRLKKQRDFAVHIAGAFNGLLGEMVKPWEGDVQKLAGTRHFRVAKEGLDEFHGRRGEIGEVLKGFPALEREVGRKVGREELKGMKGVIEDWVVDRVGKERVERGAEDYRLD